MAGPRYAHDCPTCRFLGRHDRFDLYACHRCGTRVQRIVLARYGDHPYHVRHVAMRVLESDVARRIFEAQQPELARAYALAQGGV